MKNNKLHLTRLICMDFDKQITKDEDILPIGEDINAKILAYKFLVNKDAKVILSSEEKERKVEKFNDLVIQASLRKFITIEARKLGKSIANITEKELKHLSIMFEQDFYNGKYVDIPELFVNKKYMH